jgi:hypothetical protein
MHLCDQCRADRDWETDTTVLWHIKQNLAKPETDPSKARCRECTQWGGAPTFIQNPLFEICQRCALRLQQCQHCRTTTLPKEETDRLERHEALLDLFTLAMKAYGFSAAQRTFRVQADELGIDGVEEILAAIRAVHLDGRLDRPVWKKVLGANIYRHPRWCGSCGRPNGWHPALCRAERCGHLAVGTTAAYCALCATEERACEACGTSFE